MRPNRYIIFSLLLFVLCTTARQSYGQLGVSFDIKKPKQYDERVLRSEKSDQKKFKLTTRFVQNTVTHYNYFFNANNKLNEVLARAKAAHKDDYSKLLSFYNYSLDVTARDSIQLDSIIYKANTGIVLHDLRNDWVDNLYLLWGAAYYLRKDFDSAYLTFQFINYAFAEKEKDGYYRFIGSKMDGNNAMTISTKEKTSLPKKIFSEPPSRNDAFIWQIRTFLARDQFVEAASLIATLKNDINFPNRLQKDLNEVQAYWYYKQNMWDSAASHLELALDNATDKQERARWEYLLGQLYERTGDFKDAEKYYGKCISHTTDLVMDIYARLNTIRVTKDSTGQSTEKNIATLVKMAHRDRYQDYRDIIYYMAAQMELERNNTDAAMNLLLRSTQVENGDPLQKNKSFLQLAKLAFAKHLYRQSYNYYDSLQLSDTSLGDVQAITKMKESLGKIATQIEVIDRQDSLQRIASMPEEERKEFIKKLVKQLRKQQGLKDETLTGGNTLPGNSNQPQDLFSSNQNKGEWYFYNTELKTKGKVDFKSQWGNRPNVDNWRRITAVSAIISKNAADNTNNRGGGDNAKAKDQPQEITFDALSDNLPLTEDKMRESNDSIQKAMYQLGKLYLDELEDCDASVATNEKLISRYPDNSDIEEVLFNLYYCYGKTGRADRAAAIKKLLETKYADGTYTEILKTGKTPNNSKTPNQLVTKTYEDIYDLYLEGKFDEAEVQKKKADSLYGKTYWTPQLLYIESVYYVKQRKDSAATVTLNEIVNKYPGTPLAVKAANLVSVLSRRQQIEEELTRLKIETPKADSVTTVSRPVARQQARPLVDTAAKKPLVSQPQPVVSNKPPIKQPADSLVNKPVTIAPPTAFSYKTDARHYVVIVLTKVDPVFGNEAVNAFYRYNRETFYNKTMQASLVELDGDHKLVLISPFNNAQEALDYIQQIRPIAGSQIVPWLKGDKFSFSMITDANLDILKSSHDLAAYKRFLDQYWPGKF